MSFYRDSGIFDEEQLELISYAAKSIVNDISKLMILFGFAVFTDTVVLFLMVMVPFITVRIFCGGIHMKTYWGCFLATMGMIVLGMIGAYGCKEYVDLLKVISGCSILILVGCGPQVSNNKRMMTEKRRRLFERIGVVIQIVFIVSSCILPIKSIYQAGVLIALLINNLQILILYSRKEKNHAHVH